MKRNIILTAKIMLAMVLMVLSTGAIAQPRFGFRQDTTFNRGGRLQPYGLNLSDEQQEKIRELQSAYQKEVTAIRNDLAIKRAELQKLQSADKVDMDQVNKKYDEIGKLETDLSKKRFALQQNILNVLTDEQKQQYNSGRFRGYGWMGAPFYDFNGRTPNYGRGQTFRRMQNDFFAPGRRL